MATLPFLPSTGAKKHRAPLSGARRIIVTVAIGFAVFILWAMLAKVDLYKVGHHGSLNATPKSLWNLFEKRARSEGDPKLLASLMSTMLGKHGSVESKTEVPRQTLTEELRKESNLLSTHDIPATTLYVDKVIHF